MKELRLEKSRRGPRPGHLMGIQSAVELATYIAEVVRAVADGRLTTKEFADRQIISSGAARERFRIAKDLAWIRVVDTSVKQSEGYRYVSAHRD